MLGLRRRAKKLIMDALAPDTPLGAGSAAPAFSLKDQHGKVWNSADIDQPYVLCFYPGDDTPTCTKQLIELNDNLERFTELNTLVFGVNGASAASHKAFAEKHGLRFPLLVDEGRQVAQAWAAARPGIPIVFRTVYMVTRGNVRFAARGVPSMESVFAFCERQQETGFKGTGRKNRTLVPEITSFEFRKLREAESDLLIVDVREPADWKAAHIPGAINTPFSSIDGYIDQLQGYGKARPMVLVCDQGLRAPAAAKFMLENGEFHRLFTLVDGMEAFTGATISEADEKAQAG